MTTPRKRWFRMADSILREPWSRDQKLTLVLLMAHLNTRWARDGIDDSEAGRAVLSSADLMAITGRSRRDHALMMLRSLADLVTMEVDKLGDYVSIDWPKFPEFQEFATRSKGSRNKNKSPLQSESESESESESKKKRKKERAPLAPLAAGSLTLRVPKPDVFVGEALEAIEGWAARKGYSPALLAEAHERFADWVPQSGKTVRTWNQWVGAFRQIARGIAEAREQRPRLALAERESPAQARARRTKEAAAEAFRQMVAEAEGAPIVITQGRLM